jgi:hypothetical protein
MGEKNIRLLNKTLRFKYICGVTSIEVWKIITFNIDLLTSVTSTLKLTNNIVKTSITFHITHHLKLVTF